MSRSKTMLLTAVALALCLATAWTAVLTLRKRAEAIVAVGDLQECYDMAARIESFNRLPALASDGEKMAEETTGLIAAAAKAAGIPADKLIRISPESSLRLGDSVYKEKPTRVLLTDVTLAQVVGLLHSVSSSSQGLRPTSVRLSAPRDGAGETWTAEIVLGYLIYDPPETPVIRSVQ